MKNNRAMIDDQSESEDELAMPNNRISLSPLWDYDRYAELYTVSSTAIEEVAKIVKYEQLVRNNTPLSIQSKLHLGETCKGSDLVGAEAAKVHHNYYYGDIVVLTNIFVEIRLIRSDTCVELLGAGYITKAAKMKPSIAKYSVWKTDHCLNAAEIIINALRHNCLKDSEIQIDNEFLPIYTHLFKCFTINIDNNMSACLKIPSTKVQMSDLSCLYKWMLQNDAEFNIDKRLLSLLTEAKHLGIQQFVDQCWYTLSESPTLGLSELSALKYYMMAREQRCEELMILTLTRIRKLFLWIVATKEFLHFDVKELLYILKMHTICVNSEDEVFFSVLRWMEYNWEERKQHALLLFKQVRFRHLETGFRLSLFTVPENALLKELCDLYQILKWVEDALFFNMKIKDKTRPRNRQKMLNAITKSEQRNWIYIPGVPHHHNIECPRYRPLTYETFKQFLLKVQTVGKEFTGQMHYIPQKFWYPYECCPDLAGKDAGKPIQPAMYSVEVFKQYEYKDNDKKLDAKEMQAYYKSQTW